MRLKGLTLSFCFLIMTNISYVNAGSSFAELDLYAGAIPGAKKSKDLEYKRDNPNKNEFLVNVTFPELTVYTPAQTKANGTAVIIAPGGGYKGVSIDAEGVKVAKRFNQIGVTAFVLKYRIPMLETMQDKSVGPLQDIQQAIYLVRNQSQRWGVDPNKIGVMGFSAGGHLASSAAVHYKDAVNPALKGKNLRPDFQILVYPVISFKQDVTHKGSRLHLIGPELSPQMISHYSNEQQVDANTPPAFIIHAQDDKAVPVENALLYYQALHQHNVPSQLLVVPTGGHGFGLRNDYNWFTNLKEWMVNSQILIND
ncbi:alpha/beta hydrolase [Paraglaciecola sp.]|uniref:alpha/beta hydrolase n=1 Tax=Paraglaciecola sp. TaxID=1920173 RepID=UPI003EF76D4A